jgi:peptidoglycan/LPS O-acetylase OafA/YrhL
VKAAPLTTSESLALDVIRISAAALVALGHLTHRHLAVGWPDLLFMARASVAVFFVLSGFVIRYVTCRRPGTLGGYAMDRASRIYSVVLPALLVTVIVDAICWHVNPEFYSEWVGPVGHTHLLRRVAGNALFTAQIWSPASHILLNSPGSNSAFWSLNYEVLYYVLYGLAFYLSGWKRWFWLLAGLLAVGPWVFYLAPLWWVGCVAHDVYQRWNASGKTALYLDWMMAGCVACGAGLLVATRVFPRLSDALRWVQAYLISKNGLILPKEYLFGLFGTIVFLRLLALVRRVELSPRSRVVGAIKFISEGTFPLYLLHLPLLLLIATCIPYNHAGSWQKLLIFLAIFTVGVLAGHPCNQLKMKMRKLSWRRAESAAKACGIGT